MKLLWAPWRMEYIRSPKPHSCIFCFPSDCMKDRDRLLLEGTEKSLLLLNKFPYSNGHILVAPRRHIQRIDALDSSELLDLMHLLSCAQRLLEEAFVPDGFNIGINLGKAAGAGVEDHLHIHIVPRWNGDTNYMTVTGEIRVIPDHLLTAYDLLAEKLMEKSE